MMNRLLESVRNELRKWLDAGSVDSREWHPVSEASSTRCLSAPWRWLCAVTDIGKRRTSNQDLYYLSGDGSLWVVADGMGGHAAGEVASALTIQAIAEFMNSTGARAGRAVSAGDHLVRAFAAAHDRVSGRSFHDHECSGMGSTAIAGLMDGEDLHLCHVGDVRAYHLSGGRLRRLTNDHSWVWETLVMSGLLTPDQARFHPQKGRVTQAIGSPHGIAPDLNKVTLKRGDRVLLCSDGLWEAMPEHDIGAVVGSAGSMRHLSSILVERANAAGGDDNITAILYEHDRRFARL